jgi:AsmA protein
LNVRKTRVNHLDIGPSSLGLTFRDGVLNATLGGMELYDGNASGKLIIDASKPVPAFSGDFRLDGVQARPLLSDAAQFSLLSGRTKLDLNLAGTGSSTEEIKSSLTGQASFVVSDGAIEGLNITEMISSVGAGQMPNVRQGPGAKTAFADLGGSFTIAEGIAQTNNLQLQSPLLKVKAAGSVNLVEDSLDILAQPEIVAGAEGQSGANDFAGLSVPIRIEGPLQGPAVRPEIKGLFADPESAGRTVNQIGNVLQQKLKGKPVGEAIGRFLGNVQIGGEGGDAAPRRRQERQQAEPAPAQPAQDAPPAQEEEKDPDIEEILR